MSDFVKFLAVTVFSFSADIARQSSVPFDPAAGIDWFNTAFEYGAVAVLAYIFYRLWDRSYKRQNEVVNDRIAELEHERDYWRKVASDAQAAHLDEVRTNREQYREFLSPYLTVSSTPVVHDE